MTLTFNSLFIGEWIVSVMDCITYGDISLPFFFPFFQFPFHRGSKCN